MNDSQRRQFEGEMAWGLIKILFWIGIGYWIGSHK